MKRKWIMWVMLVAVVVFIALMNVPSQSWAKPHQVVAHALYQTEVSETATFVSPKFGYSFEYPSAEWTLAEEIEFDEGLWSVSLINDESNEVIIIAVMPNPDRKSSTSWFEDNISAYNQAIISINDDKLSIAHENAILVTQPKTCNTVAMLSAIFAVDDLAFTVSYFAPDDSDGLSIYQNLVESFRVASSPDAENNVPRLSLPSKSQEDCSIPMMPLSAPTKCPDAPFYIPAEGNLMTPYGCWEEPICYPYGPGATDPYFQSPHRGIDIGPISNPGIVDVYAPADGFVGLILNQQGVRVDHPAHGVSTYYAHMRNKTTGQSYVRVTQGQQVWGGQTILGKAGNWNTYETHLHFSIFTIYTNETNYSNTRDPTPYLRARDLVFYSGWQRRSMRCQSSDTTPPIISFSANNPSEDQWYRINQTLAWSVSDPGSGVDYFKWDWNDSTPDNQVNGTQGSTTLSAAGQGKHTLYVQAWDVSGNGTSIENGTLEWFGYDTIRPQPSSIYPGCNALSKQWQNTCRDPAFAWNSTDPNGNNGSGVADYAFAWGEEDTADPNNWSVTKNLDPGPIAQPGDWAQYYLHIKARDVAGNISHLSTFGLWYDGVSPTTTFVINEDAATTNQTSVLLNIDASDNGSGVAYVRASNNNLTWSEWLLYADTIPWAISPLDRYTHTVYVQVRDKAGNESPIVSDTIYLDLYPPMPHSDNYRICADVVDIGGSVGLTSTSYSLASAVGQPWSTDATGNSSDEFSEHSGFLSSITGCLPISRVVTDHYTLTQWIVASGGNLRGSTSYRLGDTAGQPAASGSNIFTSTSYMLSSGFWANISGTLPERPPDPPYYPPPLPGPTPPPPPPSPRPGDFDININEDNLYTNNPVVTVYAQAPNVPYMRLSNTEFYTDSLLMAYQVSTTWTLSTSHHHADSYTVYAWFRDAQNSIYGPYFDSIICDFAPPQGSVVIFGSDSITVSLWLEAYDDNSGVDQMRIGEDVDLTSIAWQPYTNTIIWTLQSPVVYAQFQDRAGNESPVYGSDGSVYDPDAKYRVYLPVIIRSD